MPSHKRTVVGLIIGLSMALLLAIAAFVTLRHLTRPSTDQLKDAIQRVTMPKNWRLVDETQQSGGFLRWCPDTACPFVERIWAIEPTDISSPQVRQLLESSGFKVVTQSDSCDDEPIGETSLPLCTIVGVDKSVQLELRVFGQALSRQYGAARIVSLHAAPR